jgi:hypothetical protein
MTGYERPRWLESSSPEPLHERPIRAVGAGALPYAGQLDFVIVGGPDAAPDLAAAETDWSCP